MTTPLATHARDSANGPGPATLTRLRGLAVRAPAWRVAAALGFATHLALAGTFAATFALIAAPRLRSRAAATAAGIAYGAAVWVLMANAVLPALGVAHEPIGGRYWWAFLAGHAPLVGLPISLLTTRGRR